MVGFRKKTPPENQEILELCQLHYPLILRRANYLTRDPSQAEDLAQEALIRIIKSCRKGNPNLHKPWYVINIITNLCIDHFNKTRRMVVDSDLVARNEGNIQADHEDTYFIEEALGLLPKDLRSLAVYAYVDQFSIAEMMNLTGLPERTLMRRLGKVRERLKVHLKVAVS